MTQSLHEIHRRGFDTHAQDRAGELDQDKAAQMQEMELVRQKVYELERQQVLIKQRYDEEIRRLRHEVEARGGPPSHVGVSILAPRGGVNPPAPPTIRHGPSNFFWWYNGQSSVSRQPWPCTAPASNATNSRYTAKLLSRRLSLIPYKITCVCR